LTSANHRDNLDTDKHYPHPETSDARGTAMPESGYSWQKPFKAEPIEARHVRLWVAGRVRHPDAPTLANELYIAILGSGAPSVEMTLSTAGPRIRITALGPDPLDVLYSHGPGWQIVAGLANSSGLTTDECGLWALLGTSQRPDLREPAADQHTTRGSR
jgi:hypothetical protein